MVYNDLPDEIVDLVVGCLARSKDKPAMQALMSTSRRMRLLVSARIYATTTYDQSELRLLFPRHARLRNLTIPRLTKKLRPDRGRLGSSVLSVDATPLDPNSKRTDGLLDSICIACPLVTRLIFNGLVRCLPSSLSDQLHTLRLPRYSPDASELQRLVDIRSIEILALGDLGHPSEVRSEHCAWRVLELCDPPSVGTVLAFTHWPAGVTFVCDWRFNDGFRWDVDTPARLRAAATRLSSWQWHGDINLALIGVPTVEMIECLEPIAATMNTFELEDSQIGGNGLIHAIARLPFHHLYLYKCEILESAWMDLLAAFDGSAKTKKITLSHCTGWGLGELVSFASMCRQQLRMCVSEYSEDDADMDAFITQRLPARRALLGLPPFDLTIER